MATFRRIGLCRGVPPATLTALGRLAVFATLATFAALTAFAGPALAARPGSACNRQSVSALNQYCEDIPGAGGPRTPGVGTPAVGRRLPQRVLHALSGGGHGSPLPLAVRLRLRALPAANSVPAGKRQPRHRSTDRSISAAGVWSMSPTLILILIAVALALVALAAERRRRGRARPSAG